MSRIIRSRDLPGTTVNPASLETKRMPAPDPSRPAGGLLWISRGESSEPGVSEFERRQTEAETVLQNAVTLSEKIQRDAYHEGFQQGEAAGHKLAVQKIEPVVKSLKSLIDSLAMERQSVIEQHETELIRLAYLMAVKILHREIETHSDAVVNVARAALAKVVKAKNVLIRVSPYDLEVMQQQINETEPNKDWLPANVRLEADFNITRGGCKVIADSGEIDATIETQLHLLKSILWND
jgi:flagellar assembly protein FliH